MKNSTPYTDFGMVDILIIAEGTYPYVRGGVASWIHQLITGLEEYNFGIVFLGSQKDDYEEKKYELPKNVTYYYEEFLFDEIKRPPKEVIDKVFNFEQIINMHKSFTARNPSFDFLTLDFLKDVASLKNFLYSMPSWDYIQKQYLDNVPDSPFINYIWSVKNMHIPIWKIVKIVEKIKDFKIVHSPSTGYAGFLASLLSNTYKRPFLLTEHGIYVKERKIDMLNATWVKDTVYSFQKQLGELDYSKQMWINFFEGLGKIEYKSANKIIALYEKAREIQIKYGARGDKTMVIPNGIDIEKFKPLRKKEIPKIVTLIGRVVPIKDIKTFIKAIKIASTKIPDIEGWIVGPEDEDKEYAKECRMLVKSLHLENNVKFLGFQNIMNILPKTGLLTLTSISEGMPLTIIEGFAAGLPCVSTDVGSCKELIYGKDGIKKAGEITHISDPTEIANAYIDLLSDKEKYYEYQKNAIERVETHYTKEIFLNSYKNLYERYLWRV